MGHHSHSSYVQTLITSFLLLSTCASGMEEEPLLDAAFEDNAIQLEEIIVQGENLPTAIWDGSRGYYDTNAQRKMVLKAGGDCLKFTGCGTTILTGCALGAGLFAELVRACASFSYSRSSDSLMEYVYQYLLTNLPPTIVPGASIVLIGGGIIGAIGICRAIYPQFKSRNPFEKQIKWTSLHIINKSLKDKDFQLISISPEIIASADDSSKIIWKVPSTIQRECTDNKQECYFWTIRRKLFAADREDYEILQRIKERLSRTCREEYVRTAYSLNRMLTERFPAEIRLAIFKNFPKNGEKHNLLLHMIPHQKIYDGHDIHYLTEKEVLSTYRRHQVRIHEILNHDEEPINYFIATRLEQYGWISLTPNEKYPIACQMKYFEANQMPEEAQKMYCSRKLRPTFYLPYHPDLARYYKFEHDPAYKDEYDRPSNKKIRNLLALRKEIINQREALRPFEADVNNNE